MPRRRVVLIAGAAVLLLAGALVARNYFKVQRNRAERDAAMQRNHPAREVPEEVRAFRQALFDALQPVALRNCELKRYGETNDGGYLMCSNLLGEVQSGYSYGISGYDGWGCDLSKELKIPMHQYDCFNLERPWCWRGQTIFHEECVGPRNETIDGRLFDSVQGQFAKNGDTGRRIVFKIDVEGAEWDTFLSMPDETMRQIDQMAVEFHWEEGGPHGWVSDPRYPAAIAKLKTWFEVAHLHYNNASCIADLKPFPSFAFEALFVSKRLAQVDPSRKVTLPHPEDARNSSWRPDCAL
jgi:hypothetical protein